MSHWEGARKLIIFVGNSVCGEKDRWNGNGKFVQRVNIFILLPSIYSGFLSPYESILTEKETYP